jgi:hypothetical protein
MLLIHRWSMNWTAGMSAVRSIHCKLTGIFSFRQVPTFGRDKIRKFGENASEMKKLAARDYEDLLQVRIPLLELNRIADVDSVYHSRVRWSSPRTAQH